MIHYSCKKKIRKGADNNAANNRYKKEVIDKPLLPPKGINIDLGGADMNEDEFEKF